MNYQCLKLPAEAEGWGRQQTQTQTQTQSLTYHDFMGKPKFSNCFIIHFLNNLQSKNNSLSLQKFRTLHRQGAWKLVRL